MRWIRTAVIAVLFAAWTDSAPGDDHAFEFSYRVVRNDGVLATADDIKVAVSVLTKRFKAVGLKTPTASASPTPGQLILAFPVTSSAAAVDRGCKLAERPGTFEFRICADEATEKKWRRRKEIGGVDQTDPPSELTWTPANHEQSDVLLETPERAFIAALATMKSRGVADTSVEWKSAVEGRDKTLRSEVFTEGDVSMAEAGVIIPARHVVLFSIKDDRKSAFAAFTERHLNERLAIVIDGRVETTPVIKSKLPDGGVIDGGGAKDFTEAEAEELAAVIMAGRLPGRLVDVMTPK